MAAMPAGASLPVVIVPVGADDAALDACLAALEASTPAGTRVWLADDAQGGPRVRAVVEAWRAGTRLDAEYGRRPQPLGEAAHVAAVLDACGDADAVVLAPDARVTTGWLQRMARCLHDVPAASTVTPWSNAGETAAWPRLGEVAPMPDEPCRFVDVLGALASPPVALPAAVGHAVLIRGAARRAVGGVDGESFRSWYAALIDLCLRMQAFGGQDLLCTQAFVARPAEGRPADGDLDRLAARWPRWNATLADVLMHDPLRGLRARITDAMARRDAASTAQADLFAGASS